jgi:hypothetical protein
MFKWLANAYYWFLWVTGFADTDGLFKTPDDREKITFMLRRMKERLGIVWWVLSLGTLLGVWTACIYVSWWYVLLEAFFLWLFAHVLWAYKPPDNIWK